MLSNLWENVLKNAISDIKIKQFYWPTVPKAKKEICVFQFSRPYLGFYPDPKHFIVNCEQNVVKFMGKCIEKCNFWY